MTRLEFMAWMETYVELCHPKGDPARGAVITSCTVLWLDIEKDNYVKEQPDGRMDAARNGVIGGNELEGESTQEPAESHGLGQPEEGSSDGQGSSPSVSDKSKKRPK